MDEQNPKMQWCMDEHNPKMQCSMTIAAVPSFGSKTKIVLTGPGCSKLTTSLVNVLLKFQTLLSQICQYFLLKNCEKLLQCKSFSHFFNKKYHCNWL